MSIRKIITGIFSLGAVMILVSCGEASVTQPESTDVETKNTNSKLEVFEQEVEDGQYVTCVVFDGSREGGVSCNWDVYNAKYGTINEDMN